MDDRDQEKRRATPLASRMRSALQHVRQQGAASLRGVRRSLGEAQDLLKHTETAEKLGAAVEVWRVLKKAADAQQRGNHAMAYRLLEPEVAARPDDARVVIAFWSAALACERAEEAVPALQHIIRSLAAAGEAEHAASLWTELCNAVPGARVDPGALVRIAMALEAEGAQERVIEALRQAVDPDNSGLTPGLAVRVAEMARELDRGTAMRAARRALESPDLHDAKRARLREMLVELGRVGSGAATDAPARADAAREGGVPARSRTPASTPRPVQEARQAEVPGVAVADTLASLAPATRFSDIKVAEGMPTQLREDAIAMQLAAGRKGRIEFAKIEALAVAEVGGLAPHPVWVIDLVLNWSAQDDPVLRVVRLRGDGFDPRMIVDAPADREQALRGFLSEILARSGATPLPDEGGATGAGVHSFESVEAYQRAVLQVAS